MKKTVCAYLLFGALLSLPASGAENASDNGAGKQEVKKAKKNKKDKKANDMSLAEAFAKISTDPAGRDFTIMAEQAETLVGVLVPITAPYYITVHGDKLDCKLPYFGRVFDPFAENENLTFNSTISDFKVQPGAQKTITVTFTSRTRADNYKFRIVLSADGQARMTVTPENKELIGFTGFLLLRDKI